MFGNIAERRIAREADKIISLKEDVDALSWGRVLEIGRRLQALMPEGEGGELAREVVGIAQANLSLEAKLGIEPGLSGAGAMASGMRAAEGGCAASPAAAASRTVADSAALDASAAAAAPPALVVPVASAASAALDASPVPTPLAASAAPALSPAFAASAASPVAGSFSSVGETDAIEDELAAFFENPSQPVSSIPFEALQEEGDCEPEPEPEPLDPAPALSAASPKRRFARFRHLYESRDGGLCVFEDESGHLVAVDASRLA